MNGPVPAPSARLRALLVVMLLCAVAWTFREVAGFGSVPLADDDTNIFFNPHLSAPDGPSLRWMFTNLDYVHRYMPLGWLGFATVYAFSGLDPAGYHVADIVLHGLNTWLLFLGIVRLLRRFRPDAPEGDRLLAAAAGALLWAVHPLRSELVAWCSGLLYPQATFFALLAVHAHLSELEARVRGSPWAGWCALGVLGYAASVLTYPVALFLAPALLILDFAWMGPGRRGGMIVGFLAWSAVAGASIVQNLHARYTVSSYLLPPSLGGFGPLSRLLQAFYVSADYVGKTLWTPAVVNVHDTTLFDVDTRSVFLWSCGAMVIGICILAWALRRKAPFFGLGWIAYLVMIFPNLGLMEHPHTAGDRYSYLPGCAFSIILAFALLRIRTAARPVAWAACLVAAALLSALATRQSRIWRDAQTLFTTVYSRTQLDTIHQITTSRLAYLQFLGGDVRGGRARAWEELQRAPETGGVILTWKQMAPVGPLPPDVVGKRLQEWPAAPWAVLQLAIAQGQMKGGRIEDGLAHLDAALEISPDYADARFSRAVLLAEMDRMAAVHDWLMFRGSARPRDPGREAFLASKISALYESRGLRVPAALKSPAR